MKMSPEGVAVLADREGRRLKAYLDTEGVWTIGVGHTAGAGAPIPRAGMTITRAECDAIFARDLLKYEAAVNAVLERPISQRQFDACVSLCFNIGTGQVAARKGGFAGSTVAKRINAGDLEGAAEAFLMWNKPAVILSRRRGEAAQFAPQLADQPVAARFDVLELRRSVPAPAKPKLPPAARPKLQPAAATPAPATLPAPKRSLFARAVLALFGKKAA